MGIGRAGDEIQAQPTVYDIAFRDLAEVHAEADRRLTLLESGICWNELRWFTLRRVDTSWLSVL